MVQFRTSSLVMAAIAVLTTACRSEGADISRSRSPSSEPAPASSGAASEDFAGLWAVQAADIPAACRVALTHRRVGADRAVDLENCAAGVLAGVVAWRTRGGAVELLGGGGTVRMRLAAQGPDRLIGERGLSFVRAPEA